MSSCSTTTVPTLNTAKCINYRTHHLHRYPLHTRKQVKKKLYDMLCNSLTPLLNEQMAKTEQHIKKQMTQSFRQQLLQFPGNNESLPLAKCCNSKNTTNTKHHESKNTQTMLEIWRVLSK